MYSVVTGILVSGRVVRAVLGFGRGLLALESLSTLPAGANLRTLASLAHGTRARLIAWVLHCRSFAERG